MKIPIWRTVKDIYKTIFSNLLSFVSLPTVVLLNLQFVGFYFYHYDLISPILSLVFLLVFTVLALVVYGPIISSLIQKYLLTGDNQLSFNKLIPKIDQRQRKYIMFIMYIYFYIFLLPQLAAIILGGIAILLGNLLMFDTIKTLIYIILAIAIFIIFIYSSIISLGASMIHSYVSIHNTNLKFEKLIRASSMTLMGNKWRIFFITLITLSIVGFFNGILNSIYKPQVDTIAYCIISTIDIYISFLIYASINVHIYLFFKDRFEENLAKLTAADNKTEININSDKLLLE